MDRFTITKGDLLKMPGHGYVLDRATPRGSNPRIMEVWLPPNSQRAAGRMHETLHKAIEHTLREMLRDLRQKDAQARQSASPVRMHLNASMGRPMDWTAARRKVTQVAGRLNDVERFLQVSQRFRQTPDERLAREVNIYRAPLDIVLAPDTRMLEGVHLEVGTILVQQTNEGERSLVVGEAIPTIIPHQIAALSFALLDPDSDKVVDHITSQEACKVLNGKNSRMRLSGDNVSDTRIAP